ncbi:MAG: hypothetical protein ACT6RK_16580, partial [Sphingopyxis sp.]|uniref:hypothetical protein n=1 Tax=Sphingopyxis sp. TaxID=1908224 RepID=UPI004035BD2A
FQKFYFRHQSSMGSKSRMRAHNANLCQLKAICHTLQFRRPGLDPASIFSIKDGRTPDQVRGEDIDGL